MTLRYYVGIDPGTKGGIAVLKGKSIDATIPLSSGSDDAFALCSLIVSLSRKLPVIVALEKVNGYIGKKQPGSSMFNFGMGYGILLGSLTVSMRAVKGITLLNPVPRTWQSALSLKKKTMFRTNTAWKNYLKSEANRIALMSSPRFSVTLRFSDAVLLAEYARVCHAKA